VKASARCMAGLALLLVASPSAAAADNVADAMPEVLRMLAADNAGAIVLGIVDENGSRVFSAGKLDNGSGLRPDGDSLFEIGSITKTFTVLLLQDMVERGELGLDDPVAKYLPTSVRMPTYQDREITLLDLATQTSGLPREPDNLTPSIELPENPFADYTIDRMYDFLSRHELQREPATAFGYSNVGMALLGHILELKTGEDFESLVVERICRPLAMDSTRVKLSPELTARLAAGHGSSGARAPNWEFQVYASAGALRSTANDMLKYVSAQLGLSDSRLTAAMEKTHPIRFRDAPVYGSTAMPWMDRGISDQTGQSLLGHAGGTGGYEAFIGFDKERRRGVVVLTSQQGGLFVEKLGWFILQGVPLTPEIAAGLTAGGQGRLVGVGLKLDFDRQSRTIRETEVIPNAPAARAGVLPGLVIQAINGDPTAGKSLEHCASLIRGKAGTVVRLELFDLERNETSSVDLTREKFEVG
jgi:D-alanyl-D-alanine-carboxypeptidase/D-alanyl-D-alanine-endopeptidase